MRTTRFWNTLHQARSVLHQARSVLHQARSVLRQARSVLHQARSVLKDWFRSMQTKGPKQDSHNRRRSPMPEEVLF